VATLNSEEGPGYGVALLAAVGCGAFKTIQEACRATIEVAKETAPQKAAVKAYDRGFPVYQQLYKSLRKDFKAIAALGK
jgi:xylulokinase